MHNLELSIYKNISVIQTLAWLLGIDENLPPQQIVKYSEKNEMVILNSESSWDVCEKSILIIENKVNVNFPDYKDIDSLVLYLWGLGEISARTNENIEQILIEKFSEYPYKKSLHEVLIRLVTLRGFKAKKRSIEEIGYSQLIKLSEFDWSGFQGANRQLNYGSRYNNRSYGATFIIKLCARLIPLEYSNVVETNKHEEFIGDLCSPIHDAIVFKDEQILFPLMKGSSIYLKLLAIAALLRDNDFDKNYSVTEIQSLLLFHELPIGDVIWLTAYIVQDISNKVKSLQQQVNYLTQDIRGYNNFTLSIPKGANRENWIESKVKAKVNCERELDNSKVNFDTLFKQCVEKWPESGLPDDKLENITGLISDNSLLLDLTLAISPLSDRSSIHSHIIRRIENWIGAKPEKNSIQEGFNSSFTYNSASDFEKLDNVAHCFVLLAKDKNKIIGRILGVAFQKFDKEIEGYITRPFMSARNPSLWDTSTVRLAVVHLMSILVFTKTPANKESEISKILPFIIKKINLLLKIRPFTSNSNAQEVFRDLMRETANLIVTKVYLQKIAFDIVLDVDLPLDYRARVIFSSKLMMETHLPLAINLFEEFIQAPFYLDPELKHFTESLCLLDLCIASCYKSDQQIAAQNIIQIWEKHCLIVGEQVAEYRMYANHLNLALSKEGEERNWLKNVDGFQNSNCFKLL